MKVVGAQDDLLEARGVESSRYFEIFQRYIRGFYMNMGIHLNAECWLDSLFRLTVKRFFKCVGDIRRQTVT